MKKRANVLKKAAALLAIVVGGVVFCCSRKPEKGSVEPAHFAEVSLIDQDDTEVASMDTLDSTVAEPVTEPGIWVYVCGAVRSPGVYFVASDARVFEAVELAGGFLPDACEDAVNLAGTMSDGERIFIPDVSEDAGALTVADDPAGVSQSPGKVDINRADVAELMTLPGIGEAKAQAIVAYRLEHPFQSIEEIMNVSGIKEGSFEKIRDLITT